MIGKGRIVFTVFCITALMFYSLTSMAGEGRKAGNEKGKEALPGANVQRMANTELASLIGVPDVVIIDVDNASNWGSRKSIIKGAIIMGAAYFDPIFNFIVQYPKDKTYVLYCGEENERTSAGLAQEIMDYGYKKVYVLKGGWQMWERSVDRDTFQVDPLPEGFDYNIYMSELIISCDDDSCDYL